ncbi:MAG: O-antigen ligase family protein [Planctomycetota bacterium]
MTRAPTALDWLTRVAFVLAVSLAAGRAMTLLYLRDTFIPMPLPPGEPLPTDFRGPGVRVILDALCLLPLLLVLLRRAIDATYRPAMFGGLAFLMGLSLWSFASLLWADDPFAAAVEGSTWIAAAALAWAIAATTRGWVDLRLAFGLAVGVLAANVIGGLFFLAIELPETLRQVEEDTAGILRGQNIEPGSFAAEQFLGRLRRGEYAGFNASINSYAGAIASLMLVAIGLAWSSLRSDCPTWRHFGIVVGLVFFGCIIAGVGERTGQSTAWILVGLGTALAAVGAGVAIQKNPTKLATLVVLVLPAATYLMLRTQARAAIAAFVLVLGVLALAWVLRSKLPRWTGVGIVGLVLLGFVGLLGYGLATGSMPHVSLQFRLYYWLGALGVTGDHPLLGVGFSSFSDAYLLHRVPSAAEEVRDPHNLPLRLLSELGLVGLALGLATLILIAWSLARPAHDAEAEASGSGDSGPSEPEASASASSVSPRSVVVPAALASLVPVVATIDFTADVGFVGLEVLQGIVVALAVVAGTLLVVARSAELEEADTSPAPAACAAGLAMLAMLLVQSMVAVVAFSPAVLFGVALVTGVLLGTRRAVGSRRLVWTSFGLAVVATGVFVGGFVVPMVQAERLALRADTLVRQGDLDLAQQTYADAADASPLPNDHYHDRRGRALLLMNEPSLAEAAFRHAAEIRLTSPKYDNILAGLAERRGDRDEQIARLRATIAKNPTEIAFRLRLAAALGESTDEGRVQIAETLRLNDAFAPDEPERLPVEEVERLRTLAESP